MITLEDVLTSSGAYPERATSPECTPEVINNINLLVPKINAFLQDLGIDKVIISSGFRTYSTNKAAGGSSHSNHMLGLAVDISDPDGSLDKLVSSRDDLKKKYDIWQESPDSTHGWCHLDIKHRPGHDKNTFIP